MTKNWVCLMCQRSGEEEELPEAIQAHRNELLRTAQSNANNTRIHGPSFVGPTSVCVGKIVVKEPEARARSPRPERGALPFDDQPLEIK